MHQIIDSETSLPPIVTTTPVACLPATTSTETKDEQAQTTLPLPEKPKDPISVLSSSTELTISLNDCKCIEGTKLEYLFAAGKTGPEMLVTVFYPSKNKKTVKHSYSIPVSIEEWCIENTQINSNKEIFTITIPKRTKAGKMR